MTAQTEALYTRLRGGEDVEARWSTHAKDRARELVHQGIPISHIFGAIEEPDEVYWSTKYERPCARYGSVTVAYDWDPRGYAVIVTVLPGTREAWERVYASGLVSDRDVREDLFG